MHPRFAAFPSALAERSRNVRLGPGEIPAVLAHPDWRTPAPVLIWWHGRTVSKELDPGRYLRLIRAGIGVCAVDLPGHGERPGPKLHDPVHTVAVVTQAIAEVDQVVEALADPAYGPAFDLDRLALGGMSAGGMVTLRRLCDPHPFVAAVVEATSGRLTDLYFPPPETSRRPWPIDHPRGLVEAIDPSLHMDGWRPIPLLALHAATDRVVPIDTQRRFIEDLRSLYSARGADPQQVELLTFADTGAPDEHAGFGRFGNDAKNAATDFLRRRLIDA
ncbi:MAG TPA: alpha/beta fold hydrolase [Phycisphaerales bacterium]|nr:alpha/beta fold hydrolase [Phycisphaerales bacterium]